MRSKALIAVLVLAALHVLSSPVSAAECGGADPRNADAMKGTLALDDEASTVRRDFHREDDEQTLQLVFDVANCELRDPPRVSAGPLEDADKQIPKETLARPTVQALGDEVKIVYDVRPDTFDPGTYGSLIEVSGPGIATARTPVTLSRSEPSILVPSLIGILAGALGFSVFYWTKRFANYKVTVRWPMLAVAVVFACGAGALAAIFNWLDQDVWVLHENWVVTGTTAFTQATAGVVVAMLAGVFTELPQMDEQGEKRFTFKDDAAYSAGFWHWVFDALPPVFIKRVDERSAEPGHIAENEAFRMVQGRSVTGDRTKDQVITQDHQRGDRVAIAAGASAQIESHDTYGMNSARQIITFKKKIEYDGKTFIVGWYVPVDFAGSQRDEELWVRASSQGGEELSVRAIGSLPVFRVIPADAGDWTRLRVGKASLRAAASAAADGEDDTRASGHGERA